jgi:hypothetical protein
MNMGCDAVVVAELVETIASIHLPVSTLQLLTRRGHMLLWSDTDSSLLISFILVLGDCTIMVARRSRQVGAAGEWE